MTSSRALLGTSPGDGVLAVGGGSCKVTTAEIVGRPVCQVSEAEHEDLQFLSLDQIEIVSHSHQSLSGLLGPLISKNLGTPVSQKRVRGYDPSHLSDSGSHIHETCDSYLVIPGFLASDETDALLARSRQLLDEFSLANHPLVRLFSYNHQILITLFPYPTLSHSHRPNSPPTKRITLVTTTSSRRAIKSATFLKRRPLTSRETLHVKSRGLSTRLVMVSFFSRPCSCPASLRLHDFPALHELDPVFQRVTLRNEKLRNLVRDLRFHHDPLGMCAAKTLALSNPL
jgi:hypothetical protein